MNGNSDQLAGSSSPPKQRTSTEQPGPAPSEYDDIHALVPRYLRNVLTHYHGDFFATGQTDVIIFVQVMSEGFLPIAAKYSPTGNCADDDGENGTTIVLPKLHRHRCVISPLSDLHVSKSIRKKAKKYRLTINRDLDAVVACCHRQHGTNWLYPEVVDAFRTICAKGAQGMSAMVFDDSKSPSSPIGSCPVRLYSVEIYSVRSGDLVAGELGYTVGSIYTSLTGFTVEDGAGSVQLAALGVLLSECGFSTWDLGMDMESKRRIGAKLMPRVEFVNHVRTERRENPDVILSCDAQRSNCKEILTGGVPMDIDEGNGFKSSTKKTGTTPKRNGRKKPYAKKATHTLNETNV